MSEDEQKQYNEENKMHQILHKEMLKKSDERDILNIDFYVNKLDLDKAYVAATNINTNINTNATTYYNKIKKEFNNLCYKYIKLRDLLVEEINILNSLENMLNGHILCVQEALDLNKKKFNIIKMNREYMSRSDISLMERLAIIKYEFDFYTKEQQKRKAYLCILTNRINYVKMSKFSHTSLLEKSLADIIKEHDHITVFNNNILT
jgi:hypothetical protein